MFAYWNAMYIAMLVAYACNWHIVDESSIISWRPATIEGVANIPGC